jgi:general secretion pathway protein F
MQQFHYKAYDSAGAMHQGELEALSFESARLKLKEQNLVPVSIHVPAAAGPAVSRIFFPGRSKKPGLAEIEFWTSQMALLLHNGVRVDRALDISRKAVAHGGLKKITGRIHENVRTGMPLAEAIGRHPEIFDNLYSSVIDIGEATGRLADAFSELSANLSFRKEMASRTRQAMAYPGVILFVCLLSVVFIFNFVVPRFEPLFGRMENPPLATRMLLQTAELFTRYQWLGLVLICMAPFVLPRLAKISRFRQLFDALALRIPITRRLVYTAANLRFASAMAMMLNSGVLLADALGYAVATIGNTRIRHRLQMVRESVRQGGKLSQAMARTSFLPEAYEGILEVGEEAGRMAAVFKDMEVRMRSEYEQRLSGLITFIEPVMIIAMGIVVGGIVVIMILSTISLHEISF